MISNEATCDCDSCRLRELEADMAKLQKRVADLETLQLPILGIVEENGKVVWKDSTDHL